LATGEDRDLEIELVRKDGSIFPAAFDTTAIRGPNGDYVSIRTIVRDISSLKAAQRRERISSEMLRNVLYSLDEAMLFLDANLDLQFMSPAAEARFGIRLGDAGESLVSKIVGRRSADGTSTPAGDELRTKASAVMQTGVSAEMEVASVGRGAYTLRLSPYRSIERDTKGVVITFVDSSVPKTVVQEANLETARLRSILDSMAAGVIVADKDGNITHINPAAQRMQGRATGSWRLYDFKWEATSTKQTYVIKAEDWAIGSGLCKSDCVTPLPPELNPLLRALRGENIGETQLYIERADGAGTHVSVSGCPIRSNDRPISGALVVLTDVTEHARTLESLRRTMLDVHPLLEANFYPQLAINLDEKITDVTKAMERATGFSRDRLIGRDFWYYFTEPQAARAACRETLEKGSINDRALAIRHVSGTITTVLCDARTYCDESGAAIGVLIVARDITERKRAERERAERQAPFDWVRHFRESLA
jgi:PAS domain S-box-containing protein